MHQEIGQTHAHTERTKTCREIERNNTCTERSDKHMHKERGQTCTWRGQIHALREDKHMQRDGERQTHAKRQRKTNPCTERGGGGGDVMVLTHPTDCYCYLKPSTNTLKTSLP